MLDAIVTIVRYFIRRMANGKRLSPINSIQPFSLSIRQKITSLFKDFHVILFQIGFQPIIEKGIIRKSGSYFLTVPNLAKPVP